MSEIDNLIQNGQYNIGHICTRQQCEAGRGNKTAFRWISANRESVDYSFGDLDRQSSRFAHVLLKLGFLLGDVLFTFLPKTPEQFFCFLGALKGQVICGTLFSNFGDEALVDRLGDSRAKGVITRKSLLKRILRVREQLPALNYILVTDLEEHQSDDILSYSALMREASPFRISDLKLEVEILSESGSMVQELVIVLVTSALFLLLSEVGRQRFLDRLAGKPIWFRAPIYYLGFMALLVFGLFTKHDFAYVRF